MHSGSVGPQQRKPIPRGIATDGPAILSYGFRPFFLLAGTFAGVSMLLWIGALTAGWDVGGWYGPLAWHGHEMLFGYTSAALAGFMLTAIPNWTGRLPVSGLPLLLLVLLWLLGRVTMAVPGLLGAIPTAVIDACFMPVLAGIAGREIIAGRNWKNLKILLALGALSLANIGFHLMLLGGGDVMAIFRGTVAVYVLLIALVGGRIVPSFTRNWLAKAGAAVLPRPFGRFDIIALAALGVALLLWTLNPNHLATTVAAVLAALLQSWRLAGWRGWTALEEPLLLVLHVAYAFIPIGLAGVALSSLQIVSPPAALHMLTVGAIGGMTLAVMTRASLGHTGRVLRASAITSLAYLALFMAAVVRPFAELLPDSYHLLLSVSAGCWIAAYALFLLQYAPILVLPKARARAHPQAVGAATA